MLTLTAGHQTLNGTSTYTGNTTVNGGTLTVNGSIASSFVATVFAGGTIDGTGTVGTSHHQRRHPLSGQQRHWHHERAG